MTVASSLKSIIGKVDPIGFAFRSTGVTVAATGIAHFVAPRPFVALTKPMFTEDTEKWVQVNGATETAIGLALVDRRTRLYGLIGLLAYSAYLGDRAYAAFIGAPQHE